MVSGPFLASSGWSSASEATRAGRDAAAAAMEKFSSSHPQLAVVFGSSWFDQAQLLQGVRAVTGDMPLIGGSTAGEITPEGPRTHSCVVLLLAAKDLHCSVGAGESADVRPREAGQQAAHAAVRGLSSQRRCGFLFIGDGLMTGHTDLIRGLQEGLGTSFLMAGGLAGDDLRFTGTSQYANHRVLTHGVAGVLLGGTVAIGVGLEHGFAPISKPHQITRSRATMLLELDRLPAASVYEEYFGKELVARMRQERLTRQAVAFPLGVQYGAGSQWLLRNVVAFEADGSLRCNGELPEGASLQLMMGSRQSALEAAHRAAQQAVKPLNRVGCALVMASAARPTLLGSHYAAQELARIREAIGEAVPIIGGYTYGEYATTAAVGAEDHVPFQTESVLVIALGS